jgi:hypothetical protein
MNACHTLLDGSFFGAKALNPLEKFQAARGWASTPGGSSLGTLLLLAVLIVAAAALSVMLYRRWQLERQQRRIFNRRCEQAQLTERERYVMRAITKVVRLRSPEVLFSAGEVFEGGVAKLRRSPRIKSMSDARRRDIDGLIDSLRSRLDFQKPLEWQGSEEVRPEEGAEDIAEGDRLTVTGREGRGAFDVGVTEVGPDELVVQADAPLDCRPGETWEVCYSKAGRLLELDAPVLEVRQGTVRLARRGAPRLVNRRRFARAPTSRPVQVAKLPFLASDMDPAPKTPVSGELIEIAGTGLRLKVPMDIRRGERVLLTLQFAKDDIIEAVGKVSRAVRDEGGRSVLIVELLGLTDQEIAKLIRETNAAVRDNARRQEAKREAPQWRESSDAVEQPAGQEG